MSKARSRARSMARCLAPSMANIRRISWRPRRLRQLSPPWVEVIWETSCGRRRLRHLLRLRSRRILRPLMARRRSFGETLRTGMSYRSSLGPKSSPSFSATCCCRPSTGPAPCTFNKKSLQLIHHYHFDSDCAALSGVLCIMVLFISW